MFHRYGVLNQLVETDYDVERVAEVKRRFLKLKGCMSIEEFFSGWFYGVPAEDVRRGNVEDFVAYGFYFRRLEALPPQVLTHPGLCKAHAHVMHCILSLAHTATVCNRQLQFPVARLAIDLPSASTVATVPGVTSA